jgi:hypothetical protein
MIDEWKLVQPGRWRPRSPLPLLRHTNGGSIGTLERESEGRVDQVAADPVLDSELMKPPGAEVDLLGSCLERIAEQRPNRRHASPESAELVARAVVIRHLLIEEAADARGKAQREVLIERPFEMQLGAALVICRRRTYRSKRASNVWAPCRGFHQGRKDRTDACRRPRSKRTEKTLTGRGRP